MAQLKSTLYSAFGNVTGKFLKFGLLQIENSLEIRRPSFKFELPEQQTEKIPISPLNKSQSMKTASKSALTKILYVILQEFVRIT